MTIRTKFSPGDKVWTRISGLPRQVVIGEVRTWSSSPDFTETIYVIENHGALEVKEGEVTATKQELFTL